MSQTNSTRQMTFKQYLVQLKHKKAEVIVRPLSSNLNAHIGTLACVRADFIILNIEGRSRHAIPISAIESICEVKVPNQSHSGNKIPEWAL